VRVILLLNYHEIKDRRSSGLKRTLQIVNNYIKDMHSYLTSFIVFFTQVDDATDDIVKTQELMKDIKNEILAKQQAMNKISEQSLIHFSNYIC
jgi:hypothetical protein